jgi:hypothetical protein
MYLSFKSQNCPCPGFLLSIVRLCLLVQLRFSRQTWATVGRVEVGSSEASVAVYSLLSNVGVSRVCASIVADMGEEFVAMSTEDRAMSGESVLGGAAGVASLVEAAAMASACVSIADDRGGKSMTMASGEDDNSAWGLRAWCGGSPACHVDIRGRRGGLHG